MRNMKPLVSILIPAFNAEKWIADTLRSAIAQTWERKEIIVVDDGSSDQTRTVARRFESNGVRVVTQQNQGAAAARNKAFSISQGEFIQWLDADDLISRDKITKQMQAFGHMQSKKTLLSSPWGRFFHRYGRAEFKPSALWCDLTITEWLLRKMELNLHMQTATWLTSRELAEAAGPWNTQLLGDDDGEYFCRVLLQSSGVRFVPEAKVYYRAAGTSNLSYIGMSDRKMEAQMFSMKAHIGYLRSLEESPRTRSASIQYLQNWLVFFYPNRPDLVEEAEQIAKGLGGKLELPQLSWKYSWIKALFGWGLAKRAQVFFPRIRWSAISCFDKLLSKVSNEPVESL
jgi:glycosyltransferase involved in cell wall biosynthesis